jgi:hypothetical protein
MAHTDLPITIDNDYADDPTRPDIEVHQAHHDELHYIHNLFDITDVSSWPNGGIAFFNTSSGKFEVTDPGISGSPGPAGIGMRYLGAWNSATSYVNNSSFVDVVSYRGSAWACTTSNSNSAPTSANANWTRMVPGINWLGAWSAVTTYDPGDAVLFDRHAYIALIRHTGSTPPETAGAPVSNATWSVLAAGGVDGVDGTQGDQGTPGVAGPPGPSAEALITLTDVSGTITLDAADASYYAITLTGNVTITLDDSSGRPVSAITIRLTQGGSGANAVVWANTSWALTGGSPPVLGTAVDDLNVVSFDQINGVWIGYAPGAGTGDEPPIIVPPPDVYETLDLIPWAEASAVDSGARIGINTYILGSATQLGNKIGGIVDIITTTDNGATPPVPTIAGGGVVQWYLAGTKADGQVATSRRRVTRYVARDAISAAASPITIGLPDASASHSGCIIRGVKTATIVASTFPDLAVANTVVRCNTDATNVGSAVNLITPLATEQDATDRTLMVVADSATAGITFGVEAGHSLIGTQQSMTSPTIHVNEQWNPTTFDPTPTAAFSASAIWIAIASEMEQPGAYTPPPPGIPTITVEAVLMGSDTTDQSADYDTSAAGFSASVGSGASILIGDNRMAICDVITTTGTSVDPGVPTLSGGGITSWSNEGSVVVGTSTNRSRLTRFIGWQATAAAASPLIVGVSAQASTGIEIQLVRTPTTDATVFALAQSTTKMRRYLDASESASGPAGLANDALAVPGTDSIVYALAMWNSSLATITAAGPIVPESGLTVVASTGMGGSPARQMYSMVSAVGAYDRTPSVSWGAGATSLNWGFAGTELGQAV